MSRKIVIDCSVTSLFSGGDGEGRGRRERRIDPGGVGFGKDGSGRGEKWWMAASGRRVWETGCGMGERGGGGVSGRRRSGGKGREGSHQMLLWEGGGGRWSMGRVGEISNFKICCGGDARSFGSMRVYPAARWFSLDGTSVRFL